MARTNIPVTKIAKAAGVSPATVSRVLKHPELVQGKTRVLIGNAIKNAGYDFEALVKQNSNSSNNVIMVILPTIENPFYNNILKGIKTSATAHGFPVIIYTGNIDSKNLSNLLLVSKKTCVGGIICLGRKLELSIANAIEEELPLVQCCEYNKDASSVYVSINDYLAAKNATNHILNLNYRRIAFINGPISYNYAQERLRGFEAALAEREVTIPPSWKISLPEVSYSLGLSAASQLLGTDDRPDAIFCAADVFALSVIKAANRYGLNVPRDIGVVGFDNIEVASIAVPSITTINQPAFQIGFTAGETMFERIRDPEAKPSPILLDTELISRDSIIPFHRKVSLAR